MDGPGEKLGVGLPYVSSRCLKLTRLLGSVCVVYCCTVPQNGISDRYGLEGFIEQVPPRVAHHLQRDNHVRFHNTC